MDSQSVCWHQWCPHNVLHEARFSDGDWFQLGQQLIETTNLETIEANHHEASNCMIDAISQWLQSDLKASWRNLLKLSLRWEDIYGEATAKAVRQKAGIGKATSHLQITVKLIYYCL